MTEYNGWKNYETWRVNLEMFDGLTAHDFNSHDLYNLMKALEEHATNIIEESGNGLAVDYALAFLSEVDWREIALHMMAEIQEEENEAA